MSNVMRHCSLPFPFRFSVLSISLYHADGWVMYPDSDSDNITTHHSSVEYPREWICFMCEYLF